MQKAKRFVGYVDDIVLMLNEYLTTNPNERIVKMINLAYESLLVIFEI
jgi:hypothetical protein